MKTEKVKIDRYLETTAEQRKMARAVAKDILSHPKRYQVCRGNYIIGIPWSARNKKIDKVDPEIIKNCHVCARGAMFITRALLFDKYRFPDDDLDIGGELVLPATESDFGKFNAELIECAFELHSYFEENSIMGDLAAKFGNRYRSPVNRLRAIMQNVLDNGGVFRPDKLKKKLTA